MATKNLALIINEVYP